MISTFVFMMFMCVVCVFECVRLSLCICCLYFFFDSFSHVCLLALSYSFCLFLSYLVTIIAGGLLHSSVCEREKYRVWIWASEEVGRILEELGKGKPLSEYIV